MWDVVIIGAGMAGLSTAIWARRLGLSALVLEQRNRPGGQLTAISGRIVDYPGVDPLPGSALTARLAAQAETAGAELRLASPVTSVDAARLTCDTPHETFQGGALVIATGISTRRLEVPGEDALYAHRLVRRPSHDLAWFAGRRVAVIGGGDRAAENAIILAPVAREVILLHRGEQLRARREFIAALADHPRIAVRSRARPVGFTAAPDSATIALEGGEHLHVQAICIYIGNRPNTELVAGQVALDEGGYIATDGHGQSSKPHLYAVGDVCTQPAFQSLSTAGGQAMVVAKRIAMNR